VATGVPNHAQIHANIARKLRINPKVMKSSVPQLTFEPSIGIIARDIDKLSMDIRSFREPLKRAVQQVIIPSIMRNFNVEGRPSWEPYSPATIEIRQNMGDPVNRLLNRTGALQTAMSRYNIWTVNNNAAILLDIPTKYGKIHQEGYGTSMKKAIKASGGDASAAINKINKTIRAARRSGQQLRGVDMNIPARPFVMLQAEDIPAIQAVFTKWLEERIAEHWGKMHA
jgi:phage gpG-like protein